MKLHYWDRRKERNKKLLEHYLKNKNLPQTAKDFGLRIATARHALKKMGEKFPKTVLHKNSACAKNKELVLKMCSEGYSLSKIGQAVGTNRRHALRFLRENGVTRKFPSYTEKEHHYNWKGGRIVDRDGYIRILNREHPQANRHGYVLEHRLVVEQRIGRYLLPQEVVHHRDKNKANNHPENLQLYASNAEHLAEELVGRVPKWTDDGIARMKKGGTRGLMKIHNKTHLEIRPDAYQSR